ncbi:hypothetical protein M404DRAFT_1001089 [Pisolithus tinctorius Marx 270]|uniref:Uncharacterized protein n=1 Tax=Pisolithus tinctorius Marx 270 TaxID=870435 RepID=A0A0C3P8A3_PISTI|nr:hypothetical protein M404DRAFT_1001089 [Pisolithus tinctorius Marx 270]
MYLSHLTEGRWRLRDYPGKQIHGNSDSPVEMWPSYAQHADVWAECWYRREVEIGVGCCWNVKSERQQAWTQEKAEETNYSLEFCVNIVCFMPTTRNRHFE